MLVQILHVLMIILMVVLSLTLILAFTLAIKSYHWNVAIEEVGETLANKEGLVIQRKGLQFRGGAGTEGETAGITMFSQPAFEVSFRDQNQFQFKVDDRWDVKIFGLTGQTPFEKSDPTRSEMINLLEEKVASKG